MHIRITRLTTAIIEMNIPVYFSSLKVTGEIIVFLGKSKTFFHKQMKYQDNIVTYHAIALKEINFSSRL